MKTIKDKIIKGRRLSELKAGPIDDFAKACYDTVGEGTVLLKNANNLLPLDNNESVSVFGRIQTSYYKSGTGSGGLVNVEYVTNITDSLMESGKVKVDKELYNTYINWIKMNPFDLGEGWAQEPWCQKEMPLSAQLVENAASRSEVAIVIIGRTAGEDKDNSATQGSYFLTEAEEEMLNLISKFFEKVCVVLNVGNVIDMSFVDKYDIASVLYVWHGGMEGGRAAADILVGNIVPSGKLSDTIAKTIEDYPSSRFFGSETENYYAEDIYVGYRYFETAAPERVEYPFGFGLSYTDFTINVKDIKKEENKIEILTSVTNIGEKYVGKEVVQMYFSAPQGKLGKPLRSLCGYNKTNYLSPGESQLLSIDAEISDFASYDDGAYTGNKDCMVLEPGIYSIYIGNDVKRATKVFDFKIDNLLVVNRCNEALAPVKPFKRLHPVIKNNAIHMALETVPTRTVNLSKKIKDRKPLDIEYSGNNGIKLADVAKGKKSMTQFIAQLSDFDLCCIVRGEGMGSPKVTAGTGGCFGGITNSLLEYGIPPVCVTDGPSGIRLDSGKKATSMPNGTLLACTWNDKLIEDLYVYEGMELFAYKVDALLGPGINIHRNPLNGRNFEYFSEDPLLTGNMAAAISKGLIESGVTATIKHFCCNNQEKCRSFVDSIVSERALREIYLKGFEIAVKKGNATAIMTSYNPTNGIWNAGNYDLNTIILRDEWGFKGIVMSDWWAKINDEGHEANTQNLKAMIRSQNDLYMVCTDTLEYKDNLIESLNSGLLSRGELQRSAANILKYIMETPSFENFIINDSKSSYMISKSEINMKNVKSIEDPISDVEYLFKADSNQIYKLEFEVSSACDSLAQMWITVKLDGEDAFSVSLNGTNGNVRNIERSISFKSGHNSLSFSIGSGIDLHKVVIKSSF